MTLGQAGDEFAYQKLLRELCIYAKGIVRGHLNDPIHTSELTHDILIHVHKARRTFDSTRRFIPWLHAIIEYRLIDYYRDHYASRVLEKIDLNADYRDISIDISRRDEVDGVLIAGLNLLPEKQKRAMEALKVKGLPVKAAAHEAGMRVATLKRQTLLAFESLRKPKSERMSPDAR